MQEFIARTIAQAAADGYVTTLLGRRRPIPELRASNRQTRSLGERLAVNTVMQGTAADVIKVAMIRTHDRLRAEGRSSRLVLQVHDELLLEVPEVETRAVRELVRAEMVGAYPLDPPLAVEVGVGDNWADAKDQPCPQSAPAGPSAGFHSAERRTRLARAPKAGAVCDKGRRRFEDLDEAAARVPAARGCPTSIRGAARLGTAGTRLSTAVGDSNRDKGEYQRMRRITLVAVIAATALAGLAAGAANSAAVKATKDKPKASIERAVFFAADGMRQDIVERYAQGLIPRCGVPQEGYVREGQRPSDTGAPNTGAGWYSLATGAWPGVHGSTNNTFHRGQPFANRTAAFDPGVLQVESIAQSAERSGLKVAQVEWAGGRNATIEGPTIDFQAFFSGRGSRRTSSARPVTRSSTTLRTSRRSGSSSTIPRATRARPRMPPRAPPRRPAGRARFRRRTARRTRCTFA